MPQADAEECGGSEADEFRGPKKELELGYGSHKIKDEEENGEGTADDCGSSVPEDVIEAKASDDTSEPGCDMPEEESPTTSKS